MKSYKFYLMHIVLDIILSAIVFILFYVGWSNAISIVAIPSIIIIVIICYIGYRTISTKGFLNSIAEVSVTILVYFGYLYAVRNGDDLLQKNYWFVQIFRGFVFASFAVLLITFIRKYVTAYLKYAQIYFVSNGQNGSIMYCFGKAMLCFKSSLCVPIFTSIIYKGFSTIFDLCKSKSEESASDSGIIRELYAKIKDSRVMRAGSYVSKMYIEFADECVLAYCYQHPENSLLKNALTAMTIFLKNCIEICSKIAVVTVFRILLSSAIWFCGIILFCTKFTVTFHSTVCAFVLLKLIEFIISDAMLHPLMMNVVLEAFCNSEGAEFDETLLQELPFMETIKKYDGSGVRDDLHQHVNEVGTESETHEPNVSMTTDDEVNENVVVDGEN